LIDAFDDAWRWTLAGIRADFPSIALENLDLDLESET
jgi:hypothetical protein